MRAHLFDTLHDINSKLMLLKQNSNIDKKEHRLFGIYYMFTIHFKKKQTTTTLITNQEQKDTDTKSLLGLTTHNKKNLMLLYLITVLSFISS